MIDRDDIDGMAGEYVLGTLDRDERRAVADARASDAALDKAITDWEYRLAPLSEAAPEAQPSPDLYPKIERRISSTATVEQSLNGWRAYAMAASVALFLVSAALLHQLSTAVPMAPAPQLYAVLQKEGAGPTFLVGFNEMTAMFTVTTEAANPPPDKNYELWIVAEGAAPKSMGVVQPDGRRLLRMKGLSAETIRNATFAISIEPVGGSPTGAPTGPVVFTGKLAKNSAVKREG